MAKEPTNVTFYGRLSYPVFTMAEAMLRNPGSKFPKDADKVAPEFNLLVGQAQYDKFITHVTDVFLPYCLQQHTSGEKKNALDQKQIDKIMAVINDPDDQPPYIPVQPVPEKTALLAPEAVYMIKVGGLRGQDVVLKAIVNDEDELKVPDPDLLKFPVVKPLHVTTHQMKAGDYVAATVNLYAFVSGKMPGFSASASTAVFKSEGDPFGASVSVDEDEIFMD